MKKQKRWKPAVGAIYYYLNSYFDTRYEIRISKNYFDSLLLNSGNCFRTKKEAQAAARKIKKLLREG